MFTGLVRTLGTLESTEPTPAGVRLVVDPGPGWAPEHGLHRPDRGDSIAIDGVCLTLAEPPGHNGLFAFDAIPETLRATTLGDRAAGDPLHLEPSATPTTLLGGHVVQGHVDGVAAVESVVTDGEWRVRLATPAGLEPMIVPKGSVTLAGVSLTVAAIGEGARWFEVALIPETLAKTHLDALEPGARVNLETDILARTVWHQLAFVKGGR